MGKIIHSPVKRWPGYVILFDPLTYPQAFAIEDAITEAGALEKPSRLRYNHILLKGVFACVEEWHLDGGFPNPLSVETFPATPPISSAKLIGWLLDEVMTLYKEIEEDPNG